MKKLYIPPNGLPAPSTDAISHANALLQTILSEIKKNQGKISFEKFMDLTLYAPGLGYYSAGSEKIGVFGDFTTAPEISCLFSYCVAKQCKQILDQLGGGSILEFGAGSGKMAVDILTYLSEQHALPEHYFILETSADLKEKQRKTFETQAPHVLPKIQWLETLPTQFQGVMLANEVLDAFPVHRFLIDHDAIQEYYVGWKDDAFVWITDKPTSSELENEVQKIKETYLSDIDHYTSELNLYAGAWLHTISESLASGAILLIDYGFPRDVYYHPQRSQGTLMCHYRHRAHPNPLILVGLQDITAHVDFSFIAECAVKAGLSVERYSTQADFLLQFGMLDEVKEELDLVKRLEISRQIQTLLMPHEMGELFKVMLLRKSVMLSEI